MAYHASDYGEICAMKTLRSVLSEAPLVWLLVAVPATAWVHRSRPEAALLGFVLACIAIIPLAGLLGLATEKLAARVGDAIGGFLNATLGNAAELIIALVALRAGLFDVVKASLTGSIIGTSCWYWEWPSLPAGYAIPFRPSAPSAPAPRSA
jgi:Ca2+:H+ antiporter